ncbi:hypothetical protein MMC24_000850 [Lignoscripta atroalba]|nr:hypothetical protein [Lignoscripta atroalba]
MYTKPAFLLISGLLAVRSSLAAPTANAESPYSPTSCTTVSPAIARVSEAQPVESYLPGFIISQDSNASNKQDVFAEFTIPAGSWGCQLEAYFPAAYPVQSSGQTQVYVYSVDGPLSRSPRGIDVSWAYSPAPVSHVGTVRFESDAGSATRRVINSFACQATMTYRLSIGRDYRDAGAVAFEQSESAGLRMRYNC